MESIKGAITRSGKENAEQKFMEIIQERQLKTNTRPLQRNVNTPYEMALNFRLF